MREVLQFGVSLLVEVFLLVLAVKALGRPRWRRVGLMALLAAATSLCVLGYDAIRRIEQVVQISVLPRHGDVGALLDGLDFWADVFSRALMVVVTGQLIRIVRGQRALGEESRLDGRLAPPGVGGKCEK